MSNILQQHERNTFKQMYHLNRRIIWITLMACCRLRMERHANRWKEWWAGLFSFFFFSRHYTLAPHSLTALAGSQKTLVLCALIYAPMQDIRSQWSKETNRFMSKANSNLLKNKKRSPIWWMSFPAPFFERKPVWRGKLMIQSLPVTPICAVEIPPVFGEGGRCQKSP